MRVLMLSWEYPPVTVGGLGRHVHGLAHALVAEGHDVTVVTRHADGLPLAGTDPVPGTSGAVTVVRVPEDPPRFSFADDLLAWTMAMNHALTRAALAAAASSRPEVVHGHDWLVAHAAVTVKHALGVPLVATLHATEAGRHQGWLPGPMNRSIHSVEWWLTYESRRVVVCSEHMRREATRLFELPEDACDVIPNAAGPAPDGGGPGPEALRQRFGGRRRDGSLGPLVVFAGRLVYEKGAHDLLAAVPRLRRRHPGLRVVLAGQGPFEADLREQVRALRLGRGVAFAGFLDPVTLRDLFGAADCAVVPSRYEPFGMVALEAAASGAPLVVADTGGLAEFVVDGRSGLVFPPGDVSALAAAVHAVLDDQVLARRLSRGAKDRLVGGGGSGEGFTWPVTARRTVQSYERAVAEERELAARVSVIDARHVRLLPPFTGGNLLTGAPG